MSDLEEAWDALHAATPLGWHVGRPHHTEERGVWEQYAYLRADGEPTEKDWVAIGASELECVQEMTRCLVEIGKGRRPE